MIFCKDFFLMIDLSARFNFQEIIGMDKWYDVDVRASDRSFYGTLIAKPECFRGEYKKKIEEKVVSSQIVAWIVRQLSNRKKDPQLPSPDQSFDFVIPESKGRYMKEVNVRVPNVMYWKKRSDIEDTAKGSTFSPVLGDPINVKVHMIQSDYINALDVWIARHTIITEEGPRPAVPNISSVYADIPQGLHFDEDKKDTLRPEDDHSEDPVKV